MKVITTMHLKIPCLKSKPHPTGANRLTHWGRVTHICVGKQTIIGSDNGLSPGQRQAIIWTNAGILLIGPTGTNFSEILIKSLTFSFTKMRLKVSSAKWRPFCLGLNVLTVPSLGMHTVHPIQHACFVVPYFVVVIITHNLYIMWYICPHSVQQH